MVVCFEKELLTATVCENFDIIVISNILFLSMV